jgi:hypothetical protein
MHRKAGEKIVFMNVNSHTYGRQSNYVLGYGRKSSVAIQQLVETWSRLLTKTSALSVFPRAVEDRYR